MLHFSPRTSGTVMSIWAVAEPQHRIANESIMSEEQSCGREQECVPKPTEVNGTTAVDHSGL